MEPGTNNQQEESIFSDLKELKQFEMSEYKAEIKKARNALFWVAGIIFVTELLVCYIQYGYLDTSVIIFALIISGIFVGLGLWSRQKPYLALLLGLILYIIYIIFVVIVNGMADGAAGLFKALIGGIIVKIIIIGILIRGLANARKFQHASASDIF